MKLKPCPFCGFIDEAIVGGNAPKPGLRVCADNIESRDCSWWIECDNCFAAGPHERNEEKAREEWNKRK